MGVAVFQWETLLKRVPREPSLLQNWTKAFFASLLWKNLIKLQTAWGADSEQKASCNTKKWKWVLKRYVPSNFSKKIMAISIVVLRFPIRTRILGSSPQKKDVSRFINDKHAGILMYKKIFKRKKFGLNFVLTCSVCKRVLSEPRGRWHWQDWVL